MPLHKPGDVTTQEFLRSGGRIAHFGHKDKNGHRRKTVATIAYWTDPESKVIYYGAVIYQPDEKDPLFTHEIRKRHNQWAVDRVMMSPVSQPDPFVGWTGDGQTEYHRRRHIRNQLMPFFGVEDLNNHDIDVQQLMLRACL